MVEWATGADLHKRAELVGAIPPDADPARFDRELDQALAPPGRPGTCGHSAMSSRPGWRMVFARQHGSAMGGH